jgi:hypothetical protein
MPLADPNNVGEGCAQIVPVNGGGVEGRTERGSPAEAELPVSRWLPSRQARRR